MQLLLFALVAVLTLVGVRANSNGIPASAPEQVVIVHFDYGNPSLAHRRRGPAIARTDC